MFVIEDEWHAEWMSEHVSRDEAQAELRRLANLPWDAVPNRCPCKSWRTCRRRYHVIEFDASSDPWRRLSDEAVLDMSAEKTDWLSRSTAD